MWIFGKIIYHLSDLNDLFLSIKQQAGAQICARNAQRQAGLSSGTEFQGQKDVQERVFRRGLAPGLVPIHLT
jgi:hypothetical protein